MGYIRLRDSIRRKVELLSTTDLKRFDEWIHQVIADRDQPPEEEKRNGREVVARVITSSGTMQLELVRCGKMQCKSCPHGPYWYRYWKEGGRTKSKYVGKSTNAEKIRFADQIATARPASESGHNPTLCQQTSAYIRMFNNLCS